VHPDADGGIRYAAALGRLVARDEAGQLILGLINATLPVGKLRLDLGAGEVTELGTDRIYFGIAQQGSVFELINGTCPVNVGGHFQAPLSVSRLMRSSLARWPALGGIGDAEAAAMSRRLQLDFGCKSPSPGVDCNGPLTSLRQRRAQVTTVTPRFRLNRNDVLIRYAVLCAPHWVWCVGSSPRYG
jgi:hypothetical protein